MDPIRRYLLPSAAVVATILLTLIIAAPRLWQPQPLPLTTNIPATSPEPFIPTDLVFPLMVEFPVGFNADIASLTVHLNGTKQRWYPQISRFETFERDGKQRSGMVFYGLLSQLASEAGPGQHKIDIQVNENGSARRAMSSTPFDVGKLPSPPTVSARKHDLKSLSGATLNAPSQSNKFQSQGSSALDSGDELPCELAVMLFRIVPRKFDNPKLWDPWEIGWKDYAINQLWGIENSSAQMVLDVAKSLTQLAEAIHDPHYGWKTHALSYNTTLRSPYNDSRYKLDQVEENIGYLVREIRPNPHNEQEKALWEENGVSFWWNDNLKDYFLNVTNKILFAKFLRSHIPELQNETKALIIVEVDSIEGTPQIDLPHPIGYAAFLPDNQSLIVTSRALSPKYPTFTIPEEAQVQMYAHEIGHMLGLHHDTSNPNLMQPANGEFKLRDIQTFHLYSHLLNCSDFSPEKLSGLYGEPPISSFFNNKYCKKDGSPGKLGAMTPISESEKGYKKFEQCESKLVGRPETPQELADQTFYDYRDFVWLYKKGDQVVEQFEGHPPIPYIRNADEAELIPDVVTAFRTYKEVTEFEWKYGIRVSPCVKPSHKMECTAAVTAESGTCAEWRHGEGIFPDVNKCHLGGIAKCEPTLHHGMPIRPYYQCVYEDSPSDHLNPPDHFDPPPADGPSKEKEEDNKVCGESPIGLCGGFCDGPDEECKLNLNGDQCECVDIPATAMPTPVATSTPSPCPNPECQQKGDLCGIKTLCHNGPFGSYEVDQKCVDLCQCGPKPECGPPKLEK